MKRADLLTAGVNTLLAALVSLCGIGCLITAFDLHVSSSIALCCLLFAAAACFLRGLRRGWLVLPIGALLLGLMLYRGGLKSLLSLAYVLMRNYQIGYGWNIPDFLRGYAGVTHDAGLAFLAAFSAFIAGISLAQRRTSGAIGMSIAMLTPCLVLTNTVPDPVFLELTVLCIALLALTKNVRSVDAHQGRKLTAFLLIPVLLFTNALFRANPREDYSPPKAEEPDAFLQELVNKIPILDISIPAFSIPGLTFPTGEQVGAAPNITQEVDLSEIGPQRLYPYEVMKVMADFSGTLYLRGQGFGDYSGKAWHSDSGTEVFPVENLYLDQQTVGGITITGSAYAPIRYLPYYPINSFTLTNGVLQNPNKAMYTYSTIPLQSGWQVAWGSDHPGITAGNVLDGLTDFARYAALPRDTLASAQTILAQAGVTEDMPLLNAVNTIQSFVQGSATYSLDTPAMPSDASDFAIWFLTESDTGYCVHFASAATVLLRAAGIPARYVEGYVTTVRSGNNRVLENMAHAWVEYYVPEVGWVCLEVTPGGGTNPPPTTVPSTPATDPSTIPSTPATLPSSSATQPSTPETEPSSATQPGPSVPTTTPSGGGEHPVDRQLPPWVWTVLLWIGLAAAFVALLIAQWKLRLRWKQKKFREGSPNAQALRRWREVKMLAKLRRQDAPEALHELALKAKFSQHTISCEELAQFDGYFQRSMDHLKQRPWPLRLCYRLIFAAY